MKFNASVQITLHQRVHLHAAGQSPDTWLDLPILTYRDQDILEKNTLVIRPRSDRSH